MGKVVRGEPGYCLYRVHRPRMAWSWSHDINNLGTSNQYLSKGVGLYQEPPGPSVPPETYCFRSKKVTSVGISRYGNQAFKTHIRSPLRPEVETSPGISPRAGLCHREPKCLPSSSHPCFFQEGHTAQCQLCPWTNSRSPIRT